LPQLAAGVLAEVVIEPEVGLEREARAAARLRIVEPPPVALRLADVPHVERQHLAEAAASEQQVGAREAQRAQLLGLADGAGEELELVGAGRSRDRGRGESQRCQPPPGHRLDLIR
jgi:hypothetical protein